MIDILVLRENLKQSIYENELGLFLISGEVYTPYTGFIACSSLRKAMFENEEEAIEALIDYLELHELI